MNSLSQHQQRRRAIKWRALILLTLSSLISSLLVLPDAQAQTSATVSSSQSVSTTGWGAYLVQPGTTPPPTAYVNTWISSPGVQLTYLDLLNPNAVALAGVVYNITSVDPSSSRQNVPRISIDVCVGATWNQITDSCAGTITNLGTSTGGTISSLIALSANSRQSIRLTVTKTTKVVWTTTINVSVGRTQVRAATTTNA
ncbi:MAG: hypothetical protein KGQ38_02580 [Actinomycetales bacterium]|nr:hypothetical protein [Actinomycetales bacterium]